jgi:hypothetical protein
VYRFAQIKLLIASPTCITVIVPGQLSLVVTDAMFATGTCEAHEYVAGPEQVIDGGWRSLTVMVKVHDPVLFDASVAAHVTVVVPFAKLLPDTGVQETVAPGQLSFAVGAG